MGNNLLLVGALVIGGLLFKDQIIQFVNGLKDTTVKPLGFTNIDPSIVPKIKSHPSQMSPRQEREHAAGMSGPTTAAANLAQSWYFSKDDLRLTVG